MRLMMIMIWPEAASGVGGTQQSFIWGGTVLSTVPINHKSRMFFSQP